MNPVFFWPPNLIGYFRVAVTIYALIVCFEDPITAAVCYATGQILDAFDGMVARALGQSSKFGAVLDMLTDRMATASLLVVLSHFYKQYWLVFTGLIVLDVVSHWYQMYSKLISGATTHKQSKNFLLAVYYSFPTLLIFCVGNEAFFICLYLLHFSNGPTLPFQLNGTDIGLFQLVGLISFPISLAKNFMNVVQLFDAASEVASSDLQEHKLKAKST